MTYCSETRGTKYSREERVNKITRIHQKAIYQSLYIYHILTKAHTSNRSVLGQKKNIYIYIYILADWHKGQSHQICEIFFGSIK
jgi:hypothetical protein